MTVQIDGTNGITTPGVTNTGNDTVSNGVYAKGTFTGTYADGTVVDYVSGNGRVSVGPSDTLTFYAGGPGGTSLGSMSTAGATIPSVSSNNTFGFKNRIINGGMTIDQRNAGASTTGGGYKVDRWSYGLSGSPTFNLQQNGGSVTPPVGFKNYFAATSTSAYSLGSTDRAGFFQSIEGLNCADLAWGTVNAKTITLSAWVYSSLTGTFGGVIANASYNRCYVFSYTINSANTWQYVTATISGDTTGTWATDNSAGINVSFAFAAGSGATTTAGSWGSTAYFAPTNQVNVAGTNGATFYITGVQLEVGSQATSFDFRAYGQELALCQRYYQSSQVSTPTTANGAPFYGNIYANNNARAYGLCSFKANMRASPTITLYDQNGTSGTVSQLGIADSVSSTATNIDITGFYTINRASGSFNSTFGYPIVAGYVASAEL